MHFRVLVITAISCAVVLAIFAIVYPYSAGGRQRHNLNLADDHASVIRPLLSGDPRFGNVEIGHYTGQGGAIWCIGRVADDEVALALRRVVESTDPPVAVRYTLEIDSKAEE